MAEHYTTVAQMVTKPSARPERYDRSRFEPRCSCGWKGRRTTSKQAAVDEAEAHTGAKH